MRFLAHINNKNINKIYVICVVLDGWCLILEHLLVPLGALHSLSYAPSCRPTR